jgi:hypothetical protein
MLIDLSFEFFRVYSGVAELSHQQAMKNKGTEYFGSFTFLSKENHRLSRWFQKGYAYE